ncbi:MAG: phospholipase D-like domain-containing protein [Acidimicrobiales bacterium]
MRKTRRARIPLSVGLVTAVLAALAIAVPAAQAGATSSGLRLFVEPAAGYGFIDRAIADARRTIDLSMYELEDPVIENDLVARARAGVVVRVVLDSDYGISSVNAPAAAVLERGGVHVVWAPSSQIFHAKYLITDDTNLFVGTGNFTARYYSSTRDFWILDRDRDDLAAATATFSTDFAHRSAPLGSGSGDLVWSPGSTEALVGLINSAKHSVLVENEEMDSSTIESALGSAAQRGVDVKVVMTYDAEWHDALGQLAKAGVHVRVLSTAQVYIHAKVICVDCNLGTATAFVGSENFSTSSLDYNRELGIITRAVAVTHSLWAIVLGDYSQGSPRF